LGLGIPLSLSMWNGAGMDIVKLPGRPLLEPLWKPLPRNLIHWAGARSLLRHKRLRLVQSLAVIAVLFQAAIASAFKSEGVDANVIGVFTTAARTMNCDIEGRGMGLQNGEQFCIYGESVITYNNVVERATHVNDHFQCANTIVGSDTGWTIDRIDIPPSLNEYFDHVQGGVYSWGRLEYRLIGLTVFSLSYPQGQPPKCNAYPRYVLADARLCSPPRRWVPDVSACRPAVDRTRDKPQVCSPKFGNPIAPLTGEKVQRISLARLGDQDFFMTFSNKDHLPRGQADLVFQARRPASFGLNWWGSHHRNLVRQTGDSGGSGGIADVVQVATPERFGWSTFTKNSAGQWIPQTGVNDRLESVADGWRHFDASDQRLSTFDTSGRITAQWSLQGRKLLFSYTQMPAPAVGLLERIEDQFGRGVRLQYEQPADLSLPPHVNQIVLDDGRTTRLFYDSVGNVRRIEWPDGQAREFLYEDTRHAWALTGIKDENQALHANFAFDSSGRAMSTELAGGVGRYQVNYAAAPSWNVSETYESSRLVVWRDHSWTLPEGTVVRTPNDQEVSLTAELNNGMPRLSAQTQPAGSGCAASGASAAFDSNGNAVSALDFNGNRTCSAYDLTRNLRAVHVEGLAPAQDCAAATAPGAALPAGSRKTSAQWHPRWPLATRIAEPGRLVTLVYNGQTDPFSGTVASCAPASAKLPDQTPIAVVCRRVEQATDDASGAQGFSAALSAGIAMREHKWTYNEHGQMLTHDGARTGPSDVTTYAYYTETSYSGTDPNAQGRSVGDLASVTNAVGKVTSFATYNKLGQSLSVIDPNGTATTYQYDERSRLKSESVGGSTTNHLYHPTGLLRRTTQPDGLAYLEYEYDDAHRIRLIRDNLGNSVEYTLDSMGNRVTEVYKDGSGVLRRSLSRDTDPLGRVQQVTGRE
jgi:YD repeat-containing protein